MPSLSERLRERIAREGPISFADFMEAALHDPEGGYYARGAAIGEGGDFVTSPHVSPAFPPHAWRASSHSRRRRSRDPWTWSKSGPGRGGSWRNSRARSARAIPVQLRFDVARSPSLPEPVRARLITLAGRRLTQDGVLILSAERYRSQQLNRDDALERLIELIREACEVDKPRRPTRPTLASKKRRLESKQRHGETKKLRALKPGRDS